MPEQDHSEEAAGRTELPIERGFPIGRVNEIAEKESRAKQYYRPVYTMHKWWARRPGCLFRAIFLYSLLDDETDPDGVEVYRPGENRRLGGTGPDEGNLVNAIEEVDMENPESLWEFYPKDVRIEDKEVLDPFMGGGTSLVEASRFGAETVGTDLNPVAWFVTKKQLEAGDTDAEKLEDAFERVKADVADEISQYYRTPCPNGEREGHETHDADVMYNFWVKELDCVSCGHTVPLFKDYRVAKGRYGENKDKYHVLCPDCDAVTLVDSWRDESTCGECDREFTPEDGNVTRGGNYNCPDCGQKYSISDAVEEGNEVNERLYAVEYYCSTCDREGRPKSDYKGYKRAEAADKRLFEEAKRDWNTRTDLHEYVPGESIPDGWKTTSRKFEGSAPGAGDVKMHGIEEWTDMFTERQLLCLALLLRRLDEVPSQNHREFLLLALSASLRYTNKMVGYHHTRNHIHDLFKTNSFDPPTKPTEGNVWGAKYGLGTFESTVDGVLKGVRYANAPTERYVEDGETHETAEFARPIGRNGEVRQGDMRDFPADSEFDAVVTDPPYYDNVMYSELSDYFYVWLKVLLEDDYEAFDADKTPRAESIVSNPALEKDVETFETDLSEAFETIHRALKDDGVLAFTYHHSDSESWGELLESLCDAGFDVTATYPINSDLNKFTDGEAVSFDIVIVARPITDHTPISWNSLRRRIVRTAKETRETLEENRDLAGGDIGVIEMGKCFQEYSKHHGEVRRAGEIMTAKEVVDEVYGIIQEGERGEQDVYLDLLEEREPSYSDLNKHLKRSDASEEAMKEMALFRTDGGEFALCDWSDENRQAHVQTKVEDGDPTDLDRAHFLRYRYEHDRSREEFLRRWAVDELQELCEDLAAVTGDETYLKMLDADTTLAELGDE